MGSIFCLSHFTDCFDVSSAAACHRPMVVTSLDTTPLHHLIDVSRELLDRAEYDSASIYIGEICRRASMTEDPKTSYYCHTYKGLSQYHQALNEEAGIEFFKAITFASKLGIDNFIADAYSNLAMVFVNQGDFQGGIKYNLLALENRSETDLRGKSAAYTNLGIIYFQQGNMAQALDYFLLALATDEKLGNKKDIAYSRNNIGLYYQFRQQYDQAIAYYQSAHQLCRELAIKECVVGTLNNMANIYKNQGRHDLAVQHYRDALLELEQFGDPPSIAETAGNLSQTYMTLGQYESALTYLEQAHQYNMENGLKPQVADDHANFGYLYTKKGLFDKARHHYEAAIILNKELGLIEALRNNYLHYSRLDSLSGDFTAAYTHFKMYADYHDSLIHRSNQEKILELQHQFEAKQKDEEIFRLTNEANVHRLELELKEASLKRSTAEKHNLLNVHLLNLEKVKTLEVNEKWHQAEIDKNAAHSLSQSVAIEKSRQEMALLANESELQKLALENQRGQKKIFMAAMILLVMLSFFFYKFYMTRQELRLQTLRNKIASDLHDDVGSTLSSISIFSEMAKQQSSTVVPLLDTIGDSSRKMLDAMADIVWTINPENDQFENILLRMRSFAYQMLGAKKINFEFEADEELNKIKLPMDVRKNLFLIFKEAANNMAKYSQASMAHFSIKEESDELVMSITDNGRGFDASIQGDGNGLKNMRRRAEEIGAHLTIHSQAGNGTTIQLRIAV
jgi:signal transduction histidine kinase